jgi:hypothetical protein
MRGRTSPCNSASTAIARLRTWQRIQGQQQTTVKRTAYFDNNRKEVITCGITKILQLKLFCHVGQQLFVARKTAQQMRKKKKKTSTFAPRHAQKLQQIQQLVLQVRIQSAKKSNMKTSQQTRNASDSKQHCYRTVLNGRAGQNHAPLTGERINLAKRLDYLPSVQD